jgi:MFS family permease
MWRLGFFFHEMGFGLLSIFLPLYIISIDPGNGLYYIGLFSAIALFLAIPASFLWGYLCDKTRHYKRFILLSFASSAVILYVFTYTQNLVWLIVLYGVMSMFHMAHEAPKNVLIAELYSHQDWDRSFAFYEGFTEFGWLIGLLLGFLTKTFGFGPTITLFVCSGLNLVAFSLSLILVRDPGLVFERSLVSMEKTVDFASRGIFVASRLLDGASITEKLKRENVNVFCAGLVLFSLATSILFTPLPVFINKVVSDALLPAGLVFAIYVLNSGGAVAGYLFAGRRSERSEGRKGLQRIVLFRGLFAFVFIAALSLSAGTSVVLATSLLILMGFLFAVFMVSILSLSMELIPAKKSGLFNVLIGVGGALGSFIGPFIAQTFGGMFGFFCVFVTAGIIFLVAYIFFRVL